MTGAWALGGAQQAASRWNPALPGACACCAGLHAGFRSGDRSSQGDAVRGVMSRGACLFTLPGAVAGDSKTSYRTVSRQIEYAQHVMRSRILHVGQPAQTRVRDRTRTVQRLTVDDEGARAGGRGEVTGLPRKHGLGRTNRGALRGRPRCRRALVTTPLGPPTLPGRASLPRPGRLRRAQRTHVGP